MRAKMSVPLAAIMIAAASMAAPQASPKKSKVKPTDIHVCPQTEEVVKGEPAGSAVVGKYRVFFCCGGCRTEFSRLSASDKQKRVADIAAKYVKSSK